MIAIEFFKRIVYFDTKVLYFTVVLNSGNFFMRHCIFLFLLGVCKEKLQQLSFNMCNFVVLSIRVQQYS